MSDGRTNDIAVPTYRVVERPVDRVERGDTVWAHDDHDWLTVAAVERNDYHVLLRRSDGSIAEVGYKRPVLVRVDDSPNPRAELLSRLNTFASKHKAAVGLRCRDDGTWVGSMEWGREAPDSPMVGAAAYSVEDGMYDALKALLDEAKA